MRAASSGSPDDSARETVFGSLLDRSL